MPIEERFTIHAKHDKVRRWITVEWNLPGPAAVQALADRQDRVRRDDIPCRFVITPDGETPPASA
jgi:hypothetical protein